MIVLGIDPGTASTGYGVVKGDGGGMGLVSLVECGVIRTKARDPLPSRLHEIYEEVGGFGTILLFCFDYSENPQAWRHSMELLAKEVMPKFKGLVPK